MHANKIHELLKFTRGGNPYDKLGIGKLANIKNQLPHKRDATFFGKDYVYKPLNQYTPNELLIIGVSENHIELVMHALDGGADQLWWQSGGNAGAWHGVIMGICPSFARIRRVKIDPSTKRIKYYYTEKTAYDTISVTSTIFKKKYSPITKEFIQEAKELNYRVDLNMKHALSYKKFPDHNIYPQYNQFNEK